MIGLYLFTNPTSRLTKQYLLLSGPWLANAQQNSVDRNTARGCIKAIHGKVQ